MPREVVESAKFVIKTDDGIAIRYESKGSVPKAMVSAFGLLPAKRREYVLRRAQEEHAKLLADELVRADRAARASVEAETDFHPV